jgi:hypothetical protein
MNQVPASRLPTRVFLICLVLVVSGTFAFPYVTGYGTQLFQVIVLGAWSVVARAASGAFADQNHLAVWSLAGFFNVVGFSIPALIPYSIFRRRAPVLISFALISWLIFYMGCLFILFPATDGP